PVRLRRSRTREGISVWTVMYAIAAAIAPGSDKPQKTLALSKGGKHGQGLLRTASNEPRRARFHRKGGRHVHDARRQAGRKGSAGETWKGPVHPVKTLGQHPVCPREP